MSDKFPGYYIGVNGKAHDANGNPVLIAETKSVEDAPPVLPAAITPPVEEVAEKPTETKTKKAK